MHEGGGGGGGAPDQKRIIAKIYKDRSQTKAPEEVVAMIEREYGASWLCGEQCVHVLRQENGNEFLRRNGRAR